MDPARDFRSSLARLGLGGGKLELAKLEAIIASLSRNSEAGRQVAKAQNITRIDASLSMSIFDYCLIMHIYTYCRQDA